MKTLWIEDEDALNVGRVIVTKTGTKDCVVCYSCDERDDYENRLKADIMAMLEELKEQLREMHEDFFETEHFDEAYGVSDSMDIIQEKIDALRGEEK